MKYCQIMKYIKYLLRYSPSKAGIKTEYFSKENGNILGSRSIKSLNDCKLVNALDKTKTDLAMVTCK